MVETDHRQEDLYPKPPCARGSVSPSPYKVALSHMEAWGTGPQSPGKLPFTEKLPWKYIPLHGTFDRRV